GGSLKDRLTEGPLPPDRVLDWLPDIAKALDHIHDEGVIHRDVKPGNLLFDHQENAFLSDFGISKALHDSASGLTVTGVSPGSPGYIPPEALGLEIDGAYDQYSLASVVFRCATGRRLQPHDPYLGVWNELASHLPSAAASAVEKALSVNPADRFRTCWEFAEAFASGIRGTPAPKEEPSTRTLVETPPPETPNKPKGMTLLFVSVVLLILVFAGYAYLKVRPGTEVEPSTVARDPIVELASPSPGGVTNRSSVEIRGRLRDAPGGHLLVKGRRLNPDEDGMFLALITLEKGANDIEVIGITAEGVRTESRSVDVFYDPDDPQVVLDSPGSGLVTTESRVELRGRLDDAQPYPGKALVGDREIAVEPDGSFRADLELEEGEQTVRVRGVDRVGNIGPAVAVVVVKDSIDPVLELEAPADGSFTKLATGTVRGRVDDPNLARVEVNGEAVERLSDGCFEVPVDLVEGSNEIRVRAVDAAGNEAQATRTVTRDETPPAISSLFPEDGHRTDDATVTVRGVLAEERLDRLTVAGQVVKPGDGGAFEVTVPLDVGPNRIAVSAVDRAGNRTEREIGVTRGRPPLEVIVVRPADGLVTNETAIEVEVRLEGAAVAGRVRVNGRDLPADDDGIFRGTVEIADGPNELAIAAEDPPTGRSDSARLEVVRDTASPAVRVGSLRLAAAGDLLVVTGGLSEPGCRLSAAGHDAEVDGEEPGRGRQPRLRGAHHPRGAARPRDRGGHGAPTARRVLPRGARAGGRPRALPARGRRHAGRARGADADRACRGPAARAAGRPDPRVRRAVRRPVEDPLQRRQRVLEPRRLAARLPEGDPGHRGVDRDGSVKEPALRDARRRHGGQGARPRLQDPPDPARDPRRHERACAGDRLRDPDARGVGPELRPGDRDRGLGDPERTAHRAPRSDPRGDAEARRTLISAS
ncbi:MAG: protein kinase domain-containing protein, partial [Planctomycetota bacterium]